MTTCERKGRTFEEEGGREVERWVQGLKTQLVAN